MKPPRVGEILAGAFGVLLLASLFLPWYQQSLVCVVGPCPPLRATGFEALAVLDLFLVIVALGGVGLLVVEVTQRTPAIPVAWAAIAALLGLVTVGLVLWRTLAPPPAWAGAEPVFALLALVASAGLTAGCFLSMRDEGSRGGSGVAAGAPPGGTEPIRVPGPSPGVEGDRS